MDHFGIQNFRTLKGEHLFTFNQCTLLTGPNNSGKSSLIKGLLWCSEAFHGKQIPVYPNLQTEFLSLGENDTVVNSDCENKLLSFQFPMQYFGFFNFITRESRIFIEYKHHKDNSLKLNNIVIYAAPDFLILNPADENSGEDQLIEIYFNEGKCFCKINFPFFINSLFIPKSPLFSKDVQITLFEYAFSITKSSYRKIQQFELEVLGDMMKEPIAAIFDFGNSRNWGFQWPYLSEQVERTFNEFRYKGIEVSELIKKKYSIDMQNIFLSEHGRQYFDEIHEFVRSIINSGCFGSFDSISYVKPDRTSQKRVYFLNSEDLASKLFLKSEIDSYEKAYKNFESGDNPFMEEKYSPEHWKEIQSAQLNDVIDWNKEHNRMRFVNKWLKNLGICNRHEFFYVKKYHKYSCEPVIENRDVGVVRNLADYGFGTNQLVVLLMAVAQSGGLLVLEEPETNLHPDFQSKLADIIVDGIKLFGKQFLIETHSEYLIRKLQYHVAKSQGKKDIGTRLTTDFDKDSVKIYYFNRPDRQGEQVIDEIYVTEDGRLTKDFGPGFFDESTKIIFDLWKIEGLN